jgi:excisionase family DNA binding protein
MAISDEVNVENPRQIGTTKPATAAEDSAVALLVDPASEPEGLWNADHVARLLGVTKCAVYLWTRQGHLPHVRVGPRAVRYDPAAIRRYVKRRTVPPARA